MLARTAERLLRFKEGGDFCTRCGNQSLAPYIPNSNTPTVQATGLVHWRRAAIGPALCGASGNMSCHSVWEQVSCRLCLAKREEIEGQTERQQRNARYGKWGCIATIVVIGVIILMAVLLSSNGGGCPYTVQDFGRIPRQTAETASGLFGTEAKSKAANDNSQAWQTYERVYNDKVEAMRRECE